MWKLTNTEELTIFDNPFLLHLANLTFFKALKELPGLYFSFRMVPLHKNQLQIPDNFMLTFSFTISFLLVDTK